MQELVVNKSDGIAWLIFNKLDVHNAFDDQLIASITQQLEDFANDASIRVVILAANGKCFSAGADLNWMRRMANMSREENQQDSLNLAKMMQTIHQLNKPTIALVQGPCYGGGVGIVACCDIAIGTNKASFCLSEAKLGLIPAVISPYVINALGQRWGNYYMLTAAKMSAEHACELGLLHGIVEHTDLNNCGIELAQSLMENSPQALNEIKILSRTIQPDLFSEATLQHTANKIADLRCSSEGQEGINAFLEKRQAAWIKHD